MRGTHGADYGADYRECWSLSMEVSKDRGVEWMFHPGGDHSRRGYHTRKPQQEEARGKKAKKAPDPSAIAPDSDLSDRVTLSEWLSLCPIR